MGSGSQDSSVFLESRKSVLKTWEMKWGRWEGARSGRAGRVFYFLKGDYHDQNYIPERFLHAKDRLASKRMFRAHNKNAVSDDEGLNSKREQKQNLREIWEVEIKV